VENLADELEELQDWAEGQALKRELLKAVPVGDYFQTSHGLLIPGDLLVASR